MIGRENKILKYINKNIYHQIDGISYDSDVEC